MNFLNKILSPVKTVVDNYIQPTVSESIRILPDSLLFGSGFLALLTFSPAYFIFFIAILQLGLFQHISASFLMSILPSNFSNQPGPMKCSQGYRGTSFYQLSLMTLLIKDSVIPNPIMFILSAASFYIMAMYWEFQEEYSSLGPEAVKGVKASAIMSAILILFVALWRIGMDGCDNLNYLIVSFIFGFIGFGVFHINKSIFGRDSVNLMAIPTFVNDKKSVCSTV